MTSRNFSIILGSFLVLITLTAWIMQPSTPVLSIAKVRNFFFILYLLQLVAVIISTHKESKSRYIFLLLAILTPAVEVFWHYVYVNDVSLENDMFKYFGSAFNFAFMASIYIVYCILIPMTAFITVTLLNKKPGHQTATI